MGLKNAGSGPLSVRDYPQTTAAPLDTEAPRVSVTAVKNRRNSFSGRFFSSAPRLPQKSLRLSPVDLPVTFQSMARAQTKLAGSRPAHSASRFSTFGSVSELVQRSDRRDQNRIAVPSETLIAAA